MAAPPSDRLNELIRLKTRDIIGDGSNSFTSSPAEIFRIYGDSFRERWSLVKENRILPTLDKCREIWEQLAEIIRVKASQHPFTHKIHQMTENAFLHLWAKLTPVLAELSRNSRYSASLGFILGLALGYYLKSRWWNGSYTLMKPHKMKGIVSFPSSSSTQDQTKNRNFYQDLDKESDEFGFIKVVDDLIAPRITRSDQILIQVKAASVGVIDVYNSSEDEQRVIGHDLSGIVIEVGIHVPDFEIGDQVWAVNEDGGMCCEYVVLNQKHVYKKPPEISFEGAATVPYAGIVTWNALETILSASNLNKVLIIDGTSSTGCLAVQLLRSWGMVRSLTVAVVSSRVTPLAEMLGADEILDVEGLTRQVALNQQNYEAVIYTSTELDVTADECRKRLLIPKGGTFINLSVLGGGDDRDTLLYQRKRTVKYKSGCLDNLGSMIQEAVLQPVLDSAYGLDEIDEAFQRLGAEPIVGKIVITFTRPNKTS